MQNYKELCAWLSFMLNLDKYKEIKKDLDNASEDELKEIHKTSVALFNMMNKGNKISLFFFRKFY